MCEVAIVQGGMLGWLGRDEAKRVFEVHQNIGILSFQAIIDTLCMTVIAILASKHVSMILSHH